MYRKDSKLINSCPYCTPGRLKRICIEKIPNDSLTYPPQIKSKLNKMVLLPIQSLIIQAKISYFQGPKISEVEFRLAHHTKTASTRYPVSQLLDGKNKDKHGIKCVLKFISNATTW